jgi:hypothetical protein
LDGSLLKIFQAVQRFDQDGPTAKGTTQGSSQQSLVEIGSIVSEEKIFFKFHPPFFLFLAWRPSWLEVGITGHIFNCVRHFIPPTKMAATAKLNLT